MTMRRHYRFWFKDAKAARAALVRVRGEGHPEARLVERRREPDGRYAACLSTVRPLSSGPLGSWRGVLARGHCGRW